MKARELVLLSKENVVAAQGVREVSQRLTVHTNINVQTYSIITLFPVTLFIFNVTVAVFLV